MQHAHRLSHQCMQKENEDIKAIHDRFKNHVEVISNHGGELGTNEKSWNKDKECANSSASDEKKKFRQQRMDMKTSFLCVVLFPNVTRGNLEV